MFVHHTIAKKAEKHGVKIWVEGDRFVAIDTEQNPDHEVMHASASALVDIVLSRRTGGAPEAEIKVVPMVAAAVPAVEIHDAAAESNVAGGKTVVATKYKVKYDEHDGHCGDAFGEAFSVATRSKDGTLDLDALGTVAAANDLDFAKWSHLNPGQQRMCLGNVLRAKVRKGQTVVIGRQRFEPVLDADGKVVGSKVATSRGALV